VFKTMEGVLTVGLIPATVPGALFTILCNKVGGSFECERQGVILWFRERIFRDNRTWFRARKKKKVTATWGKEIMRYAKTLTWARGT